MAEHNRGVARLPGETPNQLVRSARSAREIKSEHKRNAAYKDRFRDVVNRRQNGNLTAREAVRQVTAIAQDMAPFVWGKDHLLWDEYYNAIRLCWTAPGAGYTNRAITNRNLTAEASRSHVPIFENNFSD